MHTQVHGKQLQVGDALRAHVEEHTATIVSKYFDRPAEATVTFSRDSRAFRCDAQVHLPSGLLANSSVTAPDIYAAFDNALGRVEKQIRRHKRQLKDHSRRMKSSVDADIPGAYLHASSASEKEAETADTSEALIIAGTQEDLNSLSVSQAATELEQIDRPFLLFRNDVHDRINFVYRREDGNIGWIDPGA